MATDKQYIHECYTLYPHLLWQEILTYNHLIKEIMMHVDLYGRKGWELVQMPNSIECDFFFNHGIIKKEPVPGLLLVFKKSYYEE